MQLLALRAAVIGIDDESSIIIISYRDNINTITLTCCLSNNRSDKTVRAWRWQLGDGFVEEPFSPLLGHKYGVTSVHVSPQVNTH